MLRTGCGSGLEGCAGLSLVAWSVGTVRSNVLGGGWGILFGIGKGLPPSLGGGIARMGACG